MTSALDYWAAQEVTVNAVEQNTKNIDIDSLWGLTHEGAKTVFDRFPSSDFMRYFPAEDFELRGAMIWGGKIEMLSCMQQVKPHLISLKFVDLKENNFDCIRLFSMFTKNFGKADSPDWLSIHKTHFI